jgi:hypothetical protein
MRLLGRAERGNTTSSSTSRAAEGGISADGWAERNVTVWAASAGPASASSLLARPRTVSDCSVTLSVKVLVMTRSYSTCVR